MKTSLKYFSIALASIFSCTTLAEEIGTGQGEAMTESNACQFAKDDAQRKARNNEMVVTDFDTCECEESSAGWSCTIDFTMEYN